jgi:hypothetical protein
MMCTTTPCTSYALICGSRHKILVLSYSQSVCAQRLIQLLTMLNCLPLLHNKTSMCERIACLPLFLQFATLIVCIGRERPLSAAQVCAACCAIPVHPGA